MKEVTFTAEAGGDGECFRWQGLSKKDKIGIVGEPYYDEDRLLTEEWVQDEAEMRDVAFDPEKVEQVLGNCYPFEIMEALGVNREKRYRFTISAEEI